MAIDCVEKIVKNITSTCETARIGGLETRAWIINIDDRESFTQNSTVSNLISAITLKTGKKAYTYTGIKKSLNAGADRVKKDDRPDRWTHYFALQVFEKNAEDKQNIDKIGKVFVIVENKDKTSDDGIFEIFGFYAGLYPSSDTVRANDNDGVRYLELMNQLDETEPESPANFFITDYATTLAALVALETPAT